METTTVTCTCRYPRCERLAANLCPADYCQRQIGITRALDEMMRDGRIIECPDQPGYYERGPNAQNRSVWQRILRRIRLGPRTPNPAP